MKEKQLIEQLNNLHSIKADQSWSQKNREVLLQQVLGGETMNDFSTFSQLNLILSRMFQPAYVAVMIAVFFVASGVTGWYMSANTAPGDSLYVAKIAREKAQMTVTFDSQAKAKLNVEFAQERLAELNQVIADEQNGDREAKVAQLKNNIKQEIKTAKEHMAVPAVIPEAEGEFFIADAGKTNEEVDVSVPTETKPEVIPAVESKKEKILTEAEVLLENDDFAGVATKLGELDQVINQEETGEAEAK